MNVVTLTIEGGVEFHTLIKGFCFSRWPIYDDFSSPERKAQASFSPHLSSVCLIIFHMFSQEEPLNQFQPNLVQCPRGWREFKCVQTNQRTRPFPRGDNNEIAKIYRRLKIFFSRLTSPISTKFNAIKLSWLRGFKFIKNYLEKIHRINLNFF